MNKREINQIQPDLLDTEQRTASDRCSGQKQEQSLRIMQALSAVDPELLQRSEKGKISFLHRYGSLVAACLCVALVGLAAWTGNTMLRVEQGNEEATMIMEDSAEETVLENAMEDDAEGAFTQQELRGETMLTESYHADNPENDNWTASAEEKEDAQMEKADLYNAKADETGIVSQVSKYVPKVLPAGYVRNADRSQITENGREFVLVWDKDEDSLILRLTYDASDALPEEEWEQAFAELSEEITQLQSEHILTDYALELPDGVRIVYQGGLPEKEAAGLLLSVLSQR